MKCYTRPILAIILLTTSVYAQAQDGRKNSFGIFAGVGGAAVIQEALEGAGSTDIGTGFSIGLNYYRSLSDKVAFETGAGWYMNEVTFKSAFNPSVDEKVRHEKVSMISIPVFLRLDVSKSFFLHGGLMGDFDFSANEYLDDQSGLGAGVGLGINFPLSQKVKMQINPFINMHGLLMIEKPTYPQRLLETGIRLGIRMY
jgi:hypothetical protein